MVRIQFVAVFAVLCWIVNNDHSDWLYERLEILINRITAHGVGAWASDFRGAA
jgi:hypothetical protein